MNSKTTCDSVWWLLELELSEGVEQTFDSFDTWLEEHPQHRAAFLRLEHAWNALDRMYVSTHAGRHPPQESIGDTPRASAVTPKLRNIAGAWSR
jgi:ferric-dicitrate binding protein FerR (iron transport regulator)